MGETVKQIYSEKNKVVSRLDFIIAIHNKLFERGNAWIKHLRTLTIEELDQEELKWSEVRDKAPLEYEKPFAFNSALGNNKSRFGKALENIKIKIEHPSQKRIDDIMAERKRRKIYNIVVEKYQNENKQSQKKINNIGRGELKQKVIEFVKANNCELYKTVPSKKIHKLVTELKKQGFEITSSSIRATLSKLGYTEEKRTS